MPINTVAFRNANDANFKSSITPEIPTKDDDGALIHWKRFEGKFLVDTNSFSSFFKPQKNLSIDLEIDDFYVGECELRLDSSQQHDSVERR